MMAISLWKEGREHFALNTPFKFHMKGETFLQLIWYPTGGQNYWNYPTALFLSFSLYKSGSKLPDKNPQLLNKVDPKHSQIDKHMGPWESLTCNITGIWITCTEAGVWGWISLASEGTWPATQHSDISVVSFFPIHGHIPILWREITL